MRDRTALVATLHAVDNQGSQEAAKKAVRLAMEDVDTSTIEGVTTHFAMSRILGQSPTQTLPSDSKCPPSEAWIAWVTDSHSEDHQRALEDHLSQEDSSRGFLQSMAHSYWSEAILALLEGDFDYARLPFKRSSELCFQLNLEGRQSLLWTYAATFFPTAA